MRLAFSTIILIDPNVLLVDGVLAVGDMEFQQNCFDVFNQYCKEGVTILFVSHDLGEVRRFCDQMLLLEVGEQRAIGGTREMLDRYVYGDKDDSAQKAIDGKAAEPAEQKRWGNKKVAITDTKFLDKFGAESSRFNSLDSMIVRIYYNAAERVSDIAFGIGLYSKQGDHLMGTNTKLKNTPIVFVKAKDT